MIRKEELAELLNDAVFDEMKNCFNCNRYNGIYENIDDIMTVNCLIDVDPEIGLGHIICGKWTLKQQTTGKERL